MREILFRGKRIDNGEWVYGFYVKATHHWHKHGVHDDWIIDSAFANGGWFNVMGRHAVDPATVGQYTGLKDRNGKKIFELDIISHVKFPDEPALICWYGTGFAIKGLWYESDISSRKADIEVVGNIHDNPEMID